MQTLSFLQDGAGFVVVLVQPKGARNVGAIARAMAHFGVASLRLVAPQCDAKSLEARSMAMSAQPLLAAAEHYPTLREATKDCGWLIATTRRLGRKRRASLDPRRDATALLARAAETRVALVFGREDKGLFGDEIDLCQEQLLLAALPGAESYNLAQAVLLVLWELFMAKQNGAPVLPAREVHPSDLPASRGELEGLVGHLLETMDRIGFIPHNDPRRVARTFRGMLDRMGPSEREVRVMRGVLHQAEWKFRQLTGAGRHRSPRPKGAPSEGGGASGGGQA